MPYLGPILDAAGVARLLKITPTRFAAVRAELEAMGFPEPLQPLDRWLREQVERWVGGQAAKGTWWEHLK